MKTLNPKGLCLILPYIYCRKFFKLFFNMVYLKDDIVNEGSFTILIRGL